MRGSPPLHLALFAAAFFLFAIPLAKLTFARPQRVMTPEPVISATEAKRHEVATLIRLRLAHAPASLSLKQGDMELLPGDVLAKPASVIEQQAALVIPPDGIELSLEVTWPVGTPNTAVTVELEPDGMDTQAVTRWSEGPVLSEIISYQWRQR